MVDAGMDAVISKPFKVEDLVGKIRNLLPKSGDNAFNSVNETE